jgi:YVTN family beta-propeller protein
MKANARGLRGSIPGQSIPFMRSTILTFITALVYSIVAIPVRATYVNFEGKQTSPIRLSADGTRLFAVNTPDARLSVFDVTQPSNPRLVAEIPVGVEPVSVNPRNNDEVWVVNEVSDSISVVSVSRRIVTDTIYVKDEPADVVFANGKAFVTAARKNMISVFDVTNHTLVTNISLVGENPRAMVLNASGTKLYAAFALSGNHTTLVPAPNAPPQATNATPPMNPNLPPPPQVSLIVDASNPQWFTDSPRTNVIKYTVPDNDIAEIDTSSFAVTRYFTNVGTINLALAINPVNGLLFVGGTDARNKTHFEPNLRSTFVTNQVAKIDPSSGAVTRYDLNPGFLAVTNVSASFRSNALAQPTAIAFEPDGNSFWLAAFGSDRVAKISAGSSLFPVAQIDICPTAPGSAVDPRNKRGPRGLALNGTADRLYVLNRIANSISIIDTAAASVLKEIPIGSYDPTTPTIRQGRGFLYDAKLSGNGTVACASCHIDAEMDLIAWDLGDPTGQLVTNTTVIAPGVLTNTSVYHPMKGPMATQTLRGLNGLDPLHWRGDRTNFTHFNGAFISILGGDPLSTADINAYRDFINTINFEPNPNQNLDRTYSTNVAGGNAVVGRSAFFTTNYTGAAGLQCTTCHTGPPGPGSDKIIISKTALQESQDFKVPQLRNIYQKLSFNNAPNAVSIGGFGLTHDGTDPSLQVFLSRPVFTAIRNNTTVKNDLAAFVQSFDTGTAPAVGYSRTISATNVASAAISNDWALLESQAALGTNIDLIVKGTIDGQVHGLLYQPGPNTYRPDSTNLAALSRATLVAKINAGDTLTIMGVPPGSGLRMGIDRNEDGILDGDVPLPTLQFARIGNNAVLNWPFSAAGFALETSAIINDNSWSNSTDPLEILSGQNFVTNSISGGSRFFRLRFQP